VVNDKWWVAFDDAGLNATIDRAVLQNFSLTAAYERMRAAQMLARRQSADLWPQLDLLGGAERSEVWGSGDRNGDSLVSGGLAASYEVDLWGRLSAQTDAENLRAEAAEAFLQSTALSISAEVALAWYRLAGAQEQKLVLLEQIETNRTVLQVLDERFKSGQIRAADVLRQRQLIEATLEDSNDIDAQIAVLEHVLAILQGDTPQAAASYPDAALVRLPPAPSIGLPSALLQRRPDVREALLNVQASNADLAAAISDRYPRINLSASLLTSDDALSLFDDWLASIAGQVVAPVFDGGGRRAEVLRTEGLLNQQVADYGQTVLQAFQEVEDALALEYHQRIKITQLETP
jgi:NodT family efflux transporter outer membrane factor (OMF) lipoprotein